VTGAREVPFGDLRIRCDDAVLSPRSWTLAQASWAVELAADLPSGPALELCAGAGQIGLAFAHATGRDLVQVDRNPRACELARENAVAAGVSSDVRCGDLLGALADDERFPVILADPPYIPSEEIGRFPDDPTMAIDGGRDGLEVARVCVAAIARHLTPDGAAVLQLGGAHQHAPLAPAIRDHGLVVAGERDHGPDRSLVHLRHA